MKEYEGKGTINRTVKGNVCLGNNSREKGDIESENSGQINWRGIRIVQKWRKRGTYFKCRVGLQIRQSNCFR